MLTEMTGEEKDSVEEKNRKIGDDNFYANILDERGLNDLATVRSPSVAVVRKGEELAMLTTQEEGIAFLTKKYRNLIDCLNTGFPAKRVCEQIDELSSLLDTDECFKEYAKVNFRFGEYLSIPSNWTGSHNDVRLKENAIIKYLDLMSNESNNGLFVGSIVRPVFMSYKHNNDWKSGFIYKDLEGEEKKDYISHSTYALERDIAFPPGSIGEIIGFSYNRVVVKFEDCLDYKFSKEWAPAKFYWKDGRTNVGAYIHEELARIPLNPIDRDVLFNKVLKLQERLNPKKS